jgi:hypothetical protein
MKRLARWALAALAAAVALVGAPSARAQDEAKPLVIGNTQLFLIRSGDTLNGRQMSVQDRIDHVQDVFAKYLGGQYAKFTWKKFGQRVHIYLNGEFVLAVTPADAQATAYKQAEKLAPIWVKGLQKGFAEGHTRQGG